ncbi:MAG: hypothetical protein ABI895_31350 [Deltaproteobacteria bacterium]
MEDARQRSIQRYVLDHLPHRIAVSNVSGRDGDVNAERLQLGYRIPRSRSRQSVTADEK